MRSQNLVKEVLKNVENEQLCYRAIDRYGKSLSCHAIICNRLSEFKKTIKYFLKYQNFLKISKENNLEFIMALLHDIKSPMASIDFALRQIKRKNEIISNVHYTNKAVLNLIEDLLDDYNFDTGEKSLKLEKISVREILDNQIFFHKYIFIQKGLKIIKTIEFDDKITGDKNALSRLFSNLISNATKFAPKNSTIKMKLTKNKKNAEFYIENDSRGLEKEYKKKIFEKFETNSGSTGLGLYICKKITDKIKGKINIQNSQNSVAFSVLIPVN